MWYHGSTIKVPPGLPHPHPTNPIRVWVYLWSLEGVNLAMGIRAWGFRKLGLLQAPIKGQPHLAVHVHHLSKVVALLHPLPPIAPPCG